MRTIRRYACTVLAVPPTHLPAAASAALTEFGLEDGLSVATLHGRLPTVDLGVAPGIGLEAGRGQVRGAIEARHARGVTPANEEFHGDDAGNRDLLIMMGAALRQ